MSGEGVNSPIVVIISQYMHTSSQQAAYLKITQCQVSYISVKPEGEKGKAFVPGNKSGLRTPSQHQFSLELVHIDAVTFLTAHVTIL